MITTANDLSTMTKTQYVDSPRTVQTSQATQATQTKQTTETSSKSQGSDGVVMTILNSTKRKINLMERSMINEDSSSFNRNSMLQTMTQLSVKANDGDVSASNRRELRNQINAIISDMGMMTDSSTSADTTESAAMVEQSTQNILSQSNDAIMAQANQSNNQVLGLLV